MMIRRVFLSVLIVLPLYLIAQEFDDNITSTQHARQATDTQSEKKKIFSGISGGMAVHIGYAFAQSPDELFRNGSLQNLDFQRDGVVVGLGGALRLALIEHIHIGGEGYVSTMPLAGESRIRTGYGGALIGGYWTFGKFMPIIGITIGGGSTARTFVPSEPIIAHTEEDTQTIYNASYTKTPFFMMDPYVGFQIALNKHVQLLIKIDYPLPFGNANKGIGETLQWSSFINPSGPKLHIGAMFGHENRNK